jgi:putative hemolysin
MNGFASALALGAFAAAACGPLRTATPAPSASTAGIANPASVFCESNGGRLDLRTGSGGGVVGICVFPNGGECEEWAYFRGMCKPVAPPASIPSASGTPPTEAVQVPVILEIVAPQDGAVVDSPQIDVTGNASPGAVVSVNDDILIAGPDGTFKWPVTLEEGPNLIEIVASNATGAEATLELTVIYEP